MRKTPMTVAWETVTRNPRSSFVRPPVTRRRLLTSPSTHDIRVPYGVGPLRSRRGTVLIVVLLAMALLTAVIVEFAYGVYVSTAAVHNWSNLERASVYAESGLAYAVAYVNDVMKTLALRYRGGGLHTYPGRFDYAVSDPFPGEPGDITYIIEDETGKLNVNLLVMNVPDSDNHVYQAFGRLCEGLDVPVAARELIRDWIDADSDPKIRDGEVRVKNARLWTLDELYAIPGLEADWLNRLMPHLTIYGDGNVNINAADPDVLDSLFYADPTRAATGVETIVADRERKLGIPNDELADLLSRIGLSALTGRLVVKGTHFKVTSTGRIDEIRRTIETVVDVDKGFTLEYWREY